MIIVFKYVDVCNSIIKCAILFSVNMSQHKVSMESKFK